MRPDMQALVFNFYSAIYEHKIQEAKRDGTYESGVITIRATSILLEPQDQARAELLLLLWHARFFHNKVSSS